MTEQVTVLSRSPRKLRMTLADDRRIYEIPLGRSPGNTFQVDKDFLDKWAAANWDAEILDLLQWPGKPATRRPHADEFPSETPEQMAERLQASALLRGPHG